jgi:DNA-binding GntR family transcriptional regulator
VPVSGGVAERAPGGGDSSAHVGQAAPITIALELRRDILRGVIGAGDRIGQDAVAIRFGVSQNTAREAFKHLEAEGFLRSEPRRGMRVAPLSVTEVREITELRAMMEVQALKWSLPGLASGSLDQATGILRQLDRASSVDDILRLNALFHRLLYGAAGRERLLGLIEGLRLNFERYLRLTWEETDHLARSQREQYELLELCRTGKRAAAATLLRDHILETGRVLADCLELQRARKSDGV